MKQFDIYRPSGPEALARNVEAVKQGFSWPAFFFPGIWALTKHLWLYGVLLILILVPMNLTGRYALEEGLAWLWGATVLVGLAISIAVGHYGNDWRRRNLKKTGFVASGTVEAHNAKEALAGGPVESEEIEEGAAQAPQRRFSIGGLIVSGLLFLSLVGNIIMMLTRGPFLFSLLLSTAVPAVALLIRSFRPPVGLARGLAVVFGGMMLGLSTVGIEKVLLGLNRAGGEFASDLFFLVAGVFLLWLGFRRVKAKATRSE